MLGLKLIHLSKRSHRQHNPGLSPEDAKTLLCDFLTLQWRHSEGIGVSNHRVSIDYSTVCSGVDKKKYQISASLAIMRGMHGWPVNSPHKGPVTRKTFPFDDVIMTHFANDKSHGNRWGLGDDRQTSINGNHVKLDPGLNMTPLRPMKQLQHSYFALLLNNNGRSRVSSVLFFQSFA